jgi:DnaJ family protein A protein 2
MAGLSGRGGRGGTDAADIFADLFGDGMGFSFSFGPGAGSRQTNGRNTFIPYDVTLEDLYNGKNVKMNLEKEVLCCTCKGYGAPSITHASSLSRLSQLRCTRFRKTQALRRM